MDGWLLVVRKVDFDEMYGWRGGLDPIIMAPIDSFSLFSIPNPPNEITWMTSPSTMVFSRLIRANALNNKA